MSTTHLTSPISAIDFISSSTVFESPSVPGVNSIVRWSTEFLKFILPRPPVPPFAISEEHPCEAKSARISSVPDSFTTVPGGTYAGENRQQH